LTLLEGDGGPGGKRSDSGLGRGGAPEDIDEDDANDDAKEWVRDIELFDDEMVRGRAIPGRGIGCFWRGS
jgi:hypothetical protein